MPPKHKAPCAKPKAEEGSATCKECFWPIIEHSRPCTPPQDTTSALPATEAMPATPKGMPPPPQKANSPKASLGVVKALCEHGLCGPKLAVSLKEEGGCFVLCMIEFASKIAVEHRCELRGIGSMPQCFEAKEAGQKKDGGTAKQANGKDAAKVAIEDAMRKKEAGKEEKMEEATGEESGKGQRGNRRASSSNHMITWFTEGAVCEKLSRHHPPIAKLPPRVTNCLSMTVVNGVNVITGHFPYTGVTHEVQVGHILALVRHFAAANAPFIMGADFNVPPLKVEDEIKKTEIREPFPSRVFIKCVNEKEFMFFITNLEGEIFTRDLTDLGRDHPMISFVPILKNLPKVVVFNVGSRAKKAKDENSCCVPTCLAKFSEKCCNGDCNRRFCAAHAGTQPRCKHCNQLLCDKCNEHKNCPEKCCIPRCPEDKNLEECCNYDRKFCAAHAAEQPRCVHCGHLLCDRCKIHKDCAKKCCVPRCPEGFGLEECHYCDRKFCEHHANKQPRCRCHECNSLVCDECDEMLEECCNDNCDNCFCEVCAAKQPRCKHCNELLCNECGEHEDCPEKCCVSECSEDEDLDECCNCHRKFCEDHAEEQGRCERCNQLLCDDCDEHENCVDWQGKLCEAFSGMGK